MTVQQIVDERVTAFEEDTQVGDAIEEIRTSATGDDQTVYYAYVTEPDGTLSGVVSLRELLNAGDETPVAEVALDSVVYVEASESIDRAGTMFARHKFQALPVVDEEQRLLGIARAGDLIEALNEESSKQVIKELMRDVEYDPSEERAYECFECGTIVRAEDNPMECPNCGGDLRNRQTPIE